MSVSKSSTVRPFPGFRGFGAPSFTQIPNELFDQLLAELSSSELRVLLYIMRRTYGFQRNSDAISLSQFVDGIVADDGTYRDHGAGVSKSAAAAALRSLEARGFIEVMRARDARLGDRPTTYTLRMAETVSIQRTPPVQPLDTPSPKTAQEGVQPLDTQKKELQNKERKNDPPEMIEKKPMDPIADRDAILRDRWHRPEVPTSAVHDAELAAAWIELERAWDQRWKRRSG